MSVDFEEYFHASNLYPYLPANFQLLSSRAGESLEKTLAVFDKANVRATFFILGELAARRPELVKKIAAEGHEIAAHSYTHRCIFNLSSEEFELEARKVKALLEDLTGNKVKGFRAPNFSINEKTPWAHPILAKLGYEYDSSVYPIYHPRYSNPSAATEVTELSTSEGGLKIVPLATYPLKVLGKQFNLPLAGGAYWRLLPETLIARGLKKLNQKHQQPAFCYFHPWELDGEQPKFKVPPLTAWRHYGNTEKFSDILSDYLQKFSFTSYEEVLSLNKNYNL